MQDNNNHDDIRKLYESGKISGNINSFDDFLMEFYAPDETEHDEEKEEEEEEDNHGHGTQRYYSKKKTGTGLHGEEEEEEEGDEVEEPVGHEMMENFEEEFGNAKVKGLKFDDKVEYDKVMKKIKEEGIDFAYNNQNRSISANHENYKKIQKIVDDLGIKGKKRHAVEESNVSEAKTADLKSGEKALLEVFEKKMKYKFDKIERSSDRFGDLKLEGEYESKFGSIKFSSWLPLLAIRELTKWYTPKIANKTDYPDMALSGDWSGVRDTNRDTIWEIFDSEFKKYVSMNEAELQSGFGSQSFFFSKNGDASNYFFKVGEGDEHKCYVLTIGKFSKYGHPVQNKAEYGVFGIVELPEADLDQAVLDKGQFETNDNKIELLEKQLIAVLDQVSVCVADYLQKYPKCNMFFDEMQDTLVSKDYDNQLALSVDKWPGGRDTWSFQVVEKGKLNTIGK